MRNFIYFCYGLLISVVLFFMPYANATHVAYDSAGNVVGMQPNATRQSIVDSLGVLDKSTGEVHIKGTTGTTVKVPVSAAKTVGTAAIAKALGKVAAKAVPGVAAAEALAELAEVLKPVYRPNPDSGQLERPEPPGIPTDASGTGYWYNNNINTKSQTPLEACTKLGVIWWNGKTDANFKLAPPLISASYACTVRQEWINNPGQYQTIYNQIPVEKIANWYVPKYILATEVQTEADVLLRMQQQAQYKKTLYDALERDRAKTANWPADYNPTKSTTPTSVTAPPVSSPDRTTKTTTKSNPDGSTDTTTTTERTTVSPQTTGNTVGNTTTIFPTSVTQTSTTINNVTNNTTVETTTTNTPAEETPEQDDQDYSFVDSDMPPIPELYEQKYPDGIAGVWRDNKPNIKDTQFWAGVKSMFPTLGGGNCPAWSMSFSIMPGANYGSMPFNVPCWIFQAVGLIIMTTAAFTARKIIF